MTEDITKLPFDFDTTLYEPENAYWMAIFSNLVYDKVGDGNAAPDIPTIKEKLKALDSNFLKVEGFNNKSSQGIVIQHRDYVVAAFRGTDQLVDWMDNIKVSSTNGPLGNVHSGFYNALLDIWGREEEEFLNPTDGQELMWKRIQELRDRGVDTSRTNTPVWLNGLRKPKRPLWLTGHSLGGAMTTLAAAWLAERKIPFNGAYTFGQPRCGDENFQVTFDTKVKNFFRFQNNNDIVTRVPARLMGYEHVGRYIHITDKKELKADISWWHKFVDRLEGVVKNILDNEIKLEWINDHRLEEEYIEGIKTWGNRLPDKWKRFSEEQ